MISVIIPVKNGAHTIQDCLRATLAQQGLDAPYEVIVVDDGSTDNTAELAETMGVCVLRQANAGPASARNAGAMKASGDFLAFTDADCEPDPFWLQHLTRPFENPEIVGVKGAYRTRQRSVVARFIQQEYEAKYARLSRQATIDFIDTYSAAYRRNIFIQNQGFDPAFTAASVEDQEFSFRLARKGYQMVFAPQAVVYHLHVVKLRTYFRRKYNIAYWKAFMLRWLPEKALSDSHTLSSQRWQIALLGPAVLSFLAGFYWPPAWIAGVLSVLLFFLADLPFFQQILRADPALLGPAFAMLLIRAVAQLIGLAVGFLFPPARQQRRTAGLDLPARLVKRLLDIAGGLLGLLLSIPLVLLAALAIKLEDGGPVFFVQERAGENGKPFHLIKLRTMVVGSENQVDQMLKNNPLRGPAFKFPNDPRVTRVGRFLRRYSLDELPQFWNVLAGEMSLVGPRPEETWVVALYNDEQRQRLAIKPGMTGPMQVSGRGELDMPDRLALELDYIQHYSLVKDMVYLMRTLPAIINGKGAF